MTEPADVQPDQQPDQGNEESVADTDNMPMTGHPAVDEVLRSLARLGSTPVEEHPAVFEAAQETLRDILAGAGEEQGSAPTED